MKINITSGLITVALLSFCSYSFAQTNLVPNGNFDQTSKRIKKGEGELERAEPWFSPDEENVADIYSKEAKDEWAAPENKMGYQMASSEPNYVGMRLYGKKRLPRHYIQVKLNDKLVAGKDYCVSFKLALSKISRFGTNNIGAYLSKRKVRMREIEEYTIEPQIMHSENKIFDDQYLWSTICGVFTAEGGESYLTIGNFADENEMSRSDYNNMRRVKGFNQLQTQDAYYFIDDVEVFNMAQIESCSCEEEEDEGDGMQVVYQENVSEQENAEAVDKIKNQKIFFDYNSTKPASPRALITVIQEMKKNPELSITIVGHSDSKEAEEINADLAQERAQAIADYLIEKGIAENRFNVISRGADEPADETGTKSGRAKNRRVTFE